ncbi:hypothetical protein B0H19DRAFT_1193005 [Mycena capillaripes]|nr:hypothetical protein B0H19DRAFT_1193005 [Mycena capillaripes]
MLAFSQFSDGEWGARWAPNMSPFLNQMRCPPSLNQPDSGTGRKPWKMELRVSPWSFL